MERLTYRTELGVSIDKNEDCPTCSICWNCDIPPRKCNYISNALKKLADYEDLEEQSRLIKLPCKYVWRIVNKKSPKYAFTIKSPITELAIYEIEDIDKENCKYFSTKEKAEAKLKKLRGGKNEERS